MVKLLHVLATGLETWLGIWVFSQTFSKREVMEKRHILSELILYMVIVFGAYSFPVFYYKVNKWTWYLPALILASLILLIGCVLCKIVRKELRKRESLVIKLALFVSMVLWISCQYWTNYQSYPFSLLGNIFPVLFYFCFFECSFVQAYLWGFWYYTNLALLKMIYVTYTGTFQNRNYEEFFLSPRTHTYSEIIYLLVVCLVLGLFVKHIRVKPILKKVLSDKKRYFFLITIVEWVILRGLMGDGVGKIKRENLTVTLILVFGILVALTLALVNTISKIVNNERIFLDARNKTLKQQYQELNAAYERYRCLVHDERNMLFYLRECLDNGDIHTAQNFLEGYKESIASGGGGFHTGISTLDFILNVKKRKMDELQAEFALEADIEKIPMEDADFVMLIGNLLDNAIEAVEKCPSEGREIHLTLKNVNEMFFLQVKNSSAELPVVKNSRFFTGKKQKEEHGWGIESVKHIVSKYEGQVSFGYDASFFEVSILINEI